MNTITREQKVEMMLQRIDWKIEDEKEQIENARKRIESEMQNFHEMTSPDAIAKYGQEMKEAKNNIAQLYERRREVEWIIKEFVEQ